MIEIEEEATMMSDEQPACNGRSKVQSERVGDGVTITDTCCGPAALYPLLCFEMRPTDEICVRLLVNLILQPQ